MRPVVLPPAAPPPDGSSGTLGSLRRRAQRWLYDLEVGDTVHPGRAFLTPEHVRRKLELRDQGANRKNSAGLRAEAAVTGEHPPPRPHRETAAWGEGLSTRSH